MATSFVADTFTEASNTTLASHTPDVAGGAWTKHTNSDAATITVDATLDACYGPSSAQNAIYYNAATPGDADQDVRAFLVRKGAYNTGQGIRIYARMSTGSLASNPAYMLLLSNNNASFLNGTLYKYAGGSLTQIGSSFTLTMTVDAEVVVGILCVGTTVIARRSDDGGSNWTTLTSGTDSAVTAAGKAGFALTDYAASSTTGINITQFNASYGAVIPGAALISGTSTGTATGSLSLGAGTPPTLSLSSTPVATGSLSLNAGPQLPLGQSTATASGSLDLTTTSAVGSRAAPGWLGLFVLDDTAATIPLIAGGSTATATGSLSLQVPSPALIAGSSTATATGTLLLRSSVETRIATPTSLGSSQFGNSTLSSAQFGNSTVQPAVDHPVS